MIIKALSTASVIFCTLFLSCNSKAQDSTHVSFKIDNQVQDISKNFQVYFIHRNDSLKAKINNELLYVPLLTDSLYTVLFIYGEQRLLFDSIPKTMITPQGETGWVFGTESKPFDTVFGVLPNKEIKNDTTLKAIYYLHFEPEEMDGIILIKKLY